MKINKIVIELLPSANEPKEAVLLMREGKMWNAVEQGVKRGLYPSEVKFAAKIEDVINQTSL